MNKKIVLIDGGMGQELMRRSESSPHPLWSAKVLLDEPDLVEDVHIDFIRSGAKVITINTYSATPERLERDGDVSLFEKLQKRAISVAQKAREKTRMTDVRIAGCLPPLYGSYHPEVAPEFEECVDRYQRLVRQQIDEVDLFLCETMSSIKEAKAAITAATSYNKIETWCALSLEDSENSRLRSGEKLTSAVTALQEFDHEALLLNCSIPEAISSSIDKIKNSGKFSGAYANGFTSIKALNLGGTVDKLTSRRDLDPEKYTSFALDWVSKGAKIVGGCCEISPSHIAHLNAALGVLGYSVIGKLRN